MKLTVGKIFPHCTASARNVQPLGVWYLPFFLSAIINVVMEKVDPDSGKSQKKPSGWMTQSQALANCMMARRCQCTWPRCSRWKNGRGSVIPVGGCTRHDPDEQMQEERQPAVVDPNQQMQKNSRPIRHPPQVAMIRAFRLGNATVAAVQPDS